MDCFWLLFALPSPKQRYLPKAKTQPSRSGVYDLLVDLVKRNVENYEHLHKMVLNQHSKGNIKCNVKKYNELRGAILLVLLVKMHKILGK